MVLVIKGLCYQCISLHSAINKTSRTNRRPHYLYILDVNVNSVTTLEVENREKSSDVSKLVSSSMRNNAVKQ